MRPLNPKWLAGKTIAKVEMHPFQARPGNDRTVAHDPTITFTDGSQLRFFAEETEIGEYGVDLLYIPAKRAR